MRRGGDSTLFQKMSGLGFELCSSKRTVCAKGHRGLGASAVSSAQGRLWGPSERAREMGRVRQRGFPATLC